MRAFKAISPVYTWVFVLVRSCVGPPAIAWLARRLVTEADKVPAGIRCSRSPVPPRLSQQQSACSALQRLQDVADEVAASPPRACPHVLQRPGDVAD